MTRYLLLLSLGLSFYPVTGHASGPSLVTYDEKMEISKGREAEFEAVGLLQAVDHTCTATLIGPVTLLTARHCYTPGEPAVWIDGRERPHAIDTGYVLEGDAYLSDIAVIYLVEAINDLKYLPLASRIHSPITQLVVVGYGANSVLIVNGQPAWLGAGDKRIHYGLGFHYDVMTGRSAHFRVLPGDSGGPLIDKLTGAIVGVTSALVYDIEDDVFQYHAAIFAPVVSHRHEIFIQ